MAVVPTHMGCRPGPGFDQRSVSSRPPRHCSTPVEYVLAVALTHGIAGLRRMMGFQMSCSAQRSLLPPSWRPLSSTLTCPLPRGFGPRRTMQCGDCNRERSAPYSEPSLGLAPPSGGSPRSSRSKGRQPGPGLARRGEPSPLPLGPETGQGNPAVLCRVQRLARVLSTHGTHTSLSATLVWSLSTFIPLSPPGEEHSLGMARMIQSSRVYGRSLIANPKLARTAAAVSLVGRHLVAPVRRVRRPGLRLGPPRAARRRAAPVPGVTGRSAAGRACSFCSGKNVNRSSRSGGP